MGQPELVRGGQGHPCPPLCMGQAPPHTSCCIWPQHSKTEGQCQAETTRFILGGSNKLPLSYGGTMHAPPARRGGGEDPCQGDRQHVPLQLPNQQQPGPTPNMQFAPESKNHCSWEKPHPLSLAGFSFSHGSIQHASPCSCP